MGYGFDFDSDFDFNIDEVISDYYSLNRMEILSLKNNVVLAVRRQR